MKIIKTNLAFEIFCIGFIIVMYELLQIRLLSFFLGSISNFLAIPLALLGLAIGSIFYHFFQKIFSLRIKEIITSSIFPVLTLSFMLFFYIANNYFADIHISLSYPSRDSLRLLIYTLVFLPTYCLGGVMLSYFFSNKSEHIGNLYCFDLLGASSAALLTPILLTYYGLKIPIYILLLFSLLLLLKQRLFNREIKIFLSLFFCLILYLANDGHILTEHPNPRILSRTLLKKYLKKDYLVTEQTTNWNSLARTSLLQAKNTNSGNTKYAVVQDDGVSNVHVLSYRNSIKKDQLLENPSHHALPFLLGANPKSILVMFAGVGRDMILLDILANKKAKIIGVELNPAVVDIATNSVLKEFEIDNFIARKNISLLAMEGRDFLNRSMEKFDLIYVATNGSIHANKTGHSRKYLDTYQAVEAYLKLLNDGGMIIFVNQSITNKIMMIKKIFKQNDMPNFEKSLIVGGYKEHKLLDTLLLKPTGFSRVEVDLYNKYYKKVDSRMELLYAPYSINSKNRITNNLKVSINDLDIIDLDIIDDDRPFIRKVNYTNFSIFPSDSELKDQQYSANWIRVFTLVFFGIISIFIIIFFSIICKKKSITIPLGWSIYFTLTGIAYMCIQIGLMSKIELFLGNPLYAVAIVLALFLLCNAIGAKLQAVFNITRGVKTLILPILISSFLSLIFIEYILMDFISQKLFIKIILSTICIAPFAIPLGTYYPFGVSKIVAIKGETIIPLTFVFATVSSVLGSCFAMTAITNIGFTPMILLGVGGYLFSGICYLFLEK